MEISYDPSRIPDHDSEALREAMQLGLIPISVICDSKGDEFDGVQFMAYVEAVPRIGERIILQDNSTCEVARVYHSVVQIPGTRVVTMRPNVIAYRLAAE